MAHYASLVSQDALFAQGMHFFSALEMKTTQINLEDKLSKQVEAKEFKEDNHSKEAIPRHDWKQCPF